jgi:hypothetical protein
MGSAHQRRNCFKILGFSGCRVQLSYGFGTSTRKSFKDFEASRLHGATVIWILHINFNILQGFWSFRVAGWNCHVGSTHQLRNCLRMLEFSGCMVQLSYGFATSTSKLFQDFDVSRLHGATVVWIRHINTKILQGF